MQLLLSKLDNNINNPLDGPCLLIDMWLVPRAYIFIMFKNQLLKFYYMVLMLSMIYSTDILLAYLEMQINFLLKFLQSFFLKKLLNELQWLFDCRSIFANNYKKNNQWKLVIKALEINLIFCMIFQCLLHVQIGI